MSEWPFPNGISAKSAEMVAELTKNETYPSVEFHGHKFIIVGGGLTTLDDFHNFRASYAHIYRDGKIRRFGEVIGDASEVTSAAQSEETP